MPLALTRRLVKGTPLTAQEHDSNLDVLETAIAVPDGLISASGTAPIQVANGTTAAVVSISAATTVAAGSMSAADKAKLDGVAAGATANTGTVTSVTGSSPISVATGTTTPAISIAAATTVDAGSMSSADKTKLDGVATGATANSADATLLARANHTGTQIAATISDFASSSRAQTEAALIAGSNITITPAGSGATRTLTVAATGGGATNLSWTAATRTVASDTGADAVITVATGTDAGLMTAADFTKLGGVATGATANSTDAQLRDRTTHTGAQAISTVTGLQTALDAKAANGAVTGTGITMSTARLLGRGTAATGAIEEIVLGTNLSFTGTTLNATAGGGGVLAVTGTAPITSSGGSSPAIGITAASGSAAGSMSSADFTKLAGVAPGATANVGTVTGVTGTAPIASSGGAAPAIGISAASGVAAGSMSSADFTKLVGVATGATANSADATLLARVNHTGTQAAATISDFNSASRAQTEAALVAGTNITITPAGAGATRTLTVAAASAPATNVGYTASTRVLTSSTGTGFTFPLATGTDPGLMTAADFTKLGGVATGATANATDAQLRDRTTHTGAQAISTVTGLQTALDAKAANGAVTGTGITMNTARLLGRSTAANGAIEEIVLGTNLSFTGTTLNAAGGGGAPGGTTTQGQYNNAGAFAGSPGLIFDITSARPTLISFLPIAKPATPATGFTLYAESVSGRISWIGTNGFVRTLDATAITADRVCTFPNRSGTLALDIFDHTTITYAASIALDMAALTNKARTITLTGALTLTTSNLAVGQSVSLRLVPGAANRTITFPAGWTFMSLKPATLLANKTCELGLKVFGSADTDVLAYFAAQP